MLRIFIDTSSEYLSLVISKEFRVIGSTKLFVGRRINELLLGLIDSLLNSLNMTIYDIDEYYCVIGPGSFTGIRIGVSLVQGLSIGSGKSCYGLTSIDCEGIIQGKGSFSVISELKGNIFAVKEFDFENNYFSDYYEKYISEDEYHKYTLVNGKVGKYIKLESIAENIKVMDFRTNCVPMYLRRSEAEINLDKRS